MTKTKVINFNIFGEISEKFPEVKKVWFEGGEVVEEESNVEIVLLAKYPSLEAKWEATEKFQELFEDYLGFSPEVCLLLTVSSDEDSETYGELVYERVS